LSFSLSIVAHRGWSSRFPDNTLAGFIAASSVADAVELDVRRSSDGKLVLSHDPTMKGHVVANTPWSVLRELDIGDGHHPALLDEVLAALPDTMVQLEIKNYPHQSGYEPDHRLALEAAERSRKGDVITSFNPSTLNAVRLVFPDVQTGFAFEPIVTLDEAVKQCLDDGHTALVPRETIIDRPLETPETIAVFPWTVDDPDRARELADFGVSGIITNDPGLIRKHLEGTS